MSEIPMDELQASLPAFECLLLAQGYGLYCIDYTQDFSGVLDREALVDHLCASEGFREQGNLASAICPDVPRILANTGSLGDQAKLGTRSERSCTTRSCRGEVREPIGGHLADYADCPNVHLRCTFLHPDVHTRGCTCIEVSLSAGRGGDLSADTARRWWRRPWPWSPPQICRRNKVCLWPSRPPSSGRTWPCASTGVLSWPTGCRGRYSWPGTRT